MKISYKKWSRAYKEIILEITANEAQRKHESRGVYFAIVEKENEPYCFLEINNTFILVGFLDELKREYLTYQFDEIETGKLFLKHAQYWDYNGDTDEKIFSTRYFFSTDGKLKIEKVDLKTREGEVLNATKSINVSANWEKYPDFGQYEDLIKKERIKF